VTNFVLIVLTLGLLLVGIQTANTNDTPTTVDTSKTMSAPLSEAMEQIACGMTFDPSPVIVEPGPKVEAPLNQEVVISKKASMGNDSSSEPGDDTPKITRIEYRQPEQILNMLVEVGGADLVKVVVANERVEFSQRWAPAIRRWLPAYKREYSKHGRMVTREASSLPDAGPSVLFLPDNLWEALTAKAKGKGNSFLVLERISSTKLRVTTTLVGSVGSTASSVHVVTI